MIYEYDARTSMRFMAYAPYMLDAHNTSITKLLHRPSDIFDHNNMQKLNATGSL